MSISRVDYEYSIQKKYQQHTVTGILPHQKNYRYFTTKRIVLDSVALLTVNRYIPVVN